MLDDEDFLKYRFKPWHINAYSLVCYTQNLNGKTKNKFLARLVANCPEGKYVAHLNGNKFDNTKNNLRIVESRSAVRNLLKAVKGSGFSSEYRGVTYSGTSNRIKKYRAQICYDYTQITIGYYLTEDEAAWMFDQYALQLFDEYHPNLDYVLAD